MALQLRDSHIMENSGKNKKARQVRTISETALLRFFYVLFLFSQKNMAKNQIVMPTNLFYSVILQTVKNLLTLLRQTTI